MFKIGCAEQILNIPLFAELYGYSPFMGRRNLGVHDPLFCRAFYFDDGRNRAMIVYSDLCTMDELYARELRTKLSIENHIQPECIVFSATHTHSGPALGKYCGVGFGEPDLEFQQIWKQTVLQVAKKAVADAEEISHAEAGRAPLSRKLGQNRVEVEKNSTDDSIRWIRFVRPDGFCKILLHSNGMHGISMNMPFHKVVSADWMGAVNRRIKERNLASMPLFLLGPCGNVDPYTTCRLLKDDSAPEVIAEQYLADLEKDMAEGGEKLTDLSIRGSLKTVDLPVVEQTADELRRDAEEFRPIKPFLADRLEEMAIGLEHGMEFGSMQDFQVLRFGSMISLLFIPGEYFVEDGAALMAGTQAKYSIAATVSNGNGDYMPSESDMKRYPDIQSIHTSPNVCAFGFYEIYGYMVKPRFKYQDNIADFVATSLLKMEKSI